MLAARLDPLALLGLGLFMVAGCAGFARSDGGELPECTGWSNCNPGRAVCTFEDQGYYSGPAVVSDYSDGVSSDGRGPYIQGTDGVQWTVVVLGNAGLAIRHSGSARNARELTVNLNSPVPDGGGVPLGIISVGDDNSLHTQWKRVGDVSRSLFNIPVGETVTAAQMNVSLHINGRFHILQMGPQPFGHCHTGADSTRVNGAGTSSGTIYRASETKWVMDLPAGSTGRLFDVSHTSQLAVDKGLYYVRLHYEIGN